MVRNMGTIGGSIANADPAADYPAALLGLGATVRTNQRSIDADSFFTGLFETALKPGELIESVSFPTGAAAAYAKLVQPASRFAVVGVFVARGGDGVPNSVRVAVTGAKNSVFRCEPLEDALGKIFTPEAAKAVKLTPEGLNGDLHATPVYRAAMISVMASRAAAAVLAR